MAFDSRKREGELVSRQDLLLAEAELTASAPASQISMDRTVLTHACKDYVTTRNFYLDLILREMAGNATTRLEESFKKIVDEVTVLIARTFSERLRNNGRPSPQAQLFCMRVEIEESAFVNGLKRVVEAAARRDYLVGYEEIVRKHAADLEVLWADVVKRHDNYDAIEREIVAEMARAVSEAAVVAAERTATTGEQILKVTDQLLQVPIPPLFAFREGIEVAVEFVKGVVTSLKTTRDQFPVRMERFKNAYRSETGTTLVLFKNFRHQTQEFIDKYNYREAEKKSEEGQAALEECHKACQTEAQKYDCASAWTMPRGIHTIIEIANRGGELKQLAGYLADEMVNLQRALEETMLAVNAIEQLNDGREQDAKALE